ncbi:MAG: hypothetical protein WCK28_17010 [Burkholderiales bacterium]|jgi:predicted butyrate kinase (DUF1464 family)
MSEKKNVDDLRDALFATIEGLRSGTMDIERARAISEVAQTIVNTAKVEVEAAKLAGVDSAPAFLDGARDVTPPPGITGIVRHRLAG